MRHWKYNCYCLLLGLLTAVTVQAQAPYTGGQGDGYDQAGLSVEVGVLDIESTTSTVQLYPNPASRKSKAFIRLEGVQQGQQWTVAAYDLWGALNWKTETTGNEPLVLPAHHWPEGTYLIRVTTAQHHWNRKLLLF